LHGAGAEGAGLMRRSREVDPRDAEIESLKRRLSDARQDVIQLSRASDHIKKLLGRSETCKQKTPHDYDRWESDVVASVVAQQYQTQR
jgi:hypothetical protein